MTTIIDGSAGITFPNGSNAQAAPSKVLQVVQSIYSSYNSTSSTSYVDTGLSATITPLFSTSKILIMVSLQLATNTNSTESIATQIVRNSTSIRIQERNIYSGQSSTGAGVGYMYLDSPSTTSSTTYKIQWECVNGNTVRINDYQNSNGNSFSQITLMEIAQ